MRGPTRPRFGSARVTCKRFGIFDAVCVRQIYIYIYMIRSAGSMKVASKWRARALRWFAAFLLRALITFSSVHPHDQTLWPRPLV